MCPVHVLGKWVQTLPAGATPFTSVSPGAARSDLKARLFRLGIEGAGKYWLHDFRRGHAQDLVDNGGRLSEILAAGQWSSPKFTAYLDLNKVETGGVVEAHMLESEDEDEAAFCQGT